MSNDSIDHISRERIESIKESITRINCALDDYASGAMEKSAGDVQMAEKVSHVQESLRKIEKIIMGDEASIGMKSKVDIVLDHTNSMRQEIDGLRKELSSLSSSIDGVKNNSAMQIAIINSKSINWKTTAALIGTGITSLAALVVSFL